MRLIEFKRGLVFLDLLLRPLAVLNRKQISLFHYGNVASSLPPQGPGGYRSPFNNWSMEALLYFFENIFGSVFVDMSKAF